MTPNLIKHRCPHDDVAHIGQLAEKGNYGQDRSMVALAVDEHAVLEEGMARLAELLGPDFEISLFRVGGGKDDEQDAVAADSVYSIRALANSAPCAQVVVEAKASLTPAAAQQVRAAAGPAPSGLPSMLRSASWRLTA
ncbi:MAG: hypothetical protein ACRDRU_26940 [Pseudonocardiaceae bacterium]